MTTTTTTTTTTAYAAILNITCTYSARTAMVFTGSECKIVNLGGSVEVTGQGFDQCPCGAVNVEYRLPSGDYKSTCATDIV